MRVKHVIVTLMLILLIIEIAEKTPQACNRYLKGWLFARRLGGNIRAVLLKRLIKYIALRGELTWKHSGCRLWQPENREFGCSWFWH